MIRFPLIHMNRWKKLKMQQSSDALRPDIDDSDDDFEDSDDDSEIERELEERMRQAQLDGRDKIFEDVSDATSQMSMMSNTK